MIPPRVCLGVITGAHGVRGLVKVKSFTEQPEDLTRYGPLGDEAGKRQFRLTLKGRAKDALLASIEGVRDRDAAQDLRGTRLTVPRTALPAIDEPETFYYADLEGLAVEDADGQAVGTIKAVLNHGAGDLLEILPPDGGRSLLVPFTRLAVPEIDLAGGRVVVAPPEEIEARGESGSEGKTERHAEPEAAAEKDL